MKSRSSSSQHISEEISLDPPFSTSLNSEEEEGAKHAGQNVNDAAEFSQGKVQEGDNGRGQETVYEEATGSSLDDTVPQEHNDEATNFTQQAAKEVHNEIEDDAFMPGNMGLEATNASPDNDGLQDAIWKPRNLDEEIGPRGSSGGFEGDDDLEYPENGESQSAAENDAPDSGDEAHEVDDDQSDEEHEDNYEDDYDSETPTRSSEIPDPRSDIDDAQLDELDEVTTPTLDEREKSDAYSDFDGTEGENANDLEPNIDEMTLEHNYDTDLEAGHSNSDQEYDDGAEFQETNERSDYDIESEMANDLDQDEEASDGIDQASQFEDDISRDDVEEYSQRPDEDSDGDNESAGEDYDRNAVEQNSIMSDDRSERDDDLNRGDDVELPETFDVNEIVEESESMDEDENVKQDDYLEEDDELDLADQQSRSSGSAPDEEELLDAESQLGSQDDLDDPPPENALSVPIGEWTEAHMEAFRIHFRSKANVFDFLTRKGVVNRERVSGVVTEALKLCLKDSTALHGKTHATVFLEAGSTPLGPFLAFLALTIQSTMNSTKDEKNGKKDKVAKNEKIAKDKEDAGEAEEAQPSEGADEPDPWDDFDLEDNLEAPPSHLEPSKPGPVAPTLSHGDTPGKRPQVATNVMVVMFLQAVLETSRAAISGPARAYLEWTFISQELEINSRPANCKDQNDGSLHEKRSKRTAALNLTWEDVNPLEYVSIGVSFVMILVKLQLIRKLTFSQAQQMYSKQHYIHSGDAKAPVAAQMISMICERLRASETILSEYDRT